jgi:Flp pilus assembly protein CpaB
VNYYIAKGELITSSKSSGPPEVPPTVRVPPGMRAVAIRNDPISNGQNVVPGDRVDVLAAYNGPDTATTIVESVEVLAVARPSRPLDSLPPRNVVSEIPTDQDSEESVTVTIAVDVERARVLAEAQEKASKLYVLLRPTGQ